MSINFHPFQYNDEYLYEKNKKPNFDIEFGKFFFLNEEKEEEDSYNLNQLYFIKNNPQVNISNASSESKKHENLIKKEEEISGVNSENKITQIKLIVKGGKPSEEKKEKGKKGKTNKKIKNFSTRECTNDSEKSENKEEHKNTKESIVFYKNYKKFEFKESEQDDNYLQLNIINNKRIDSINKGIETNINNNKIQNDDEILNININNKINNSDNNSNKEANSLSNNDIDDNNTKKYYLLNKKTERVKSPKNNKTNHNKYITKIKINTIDTTINFINEKIKIKYNGNIGKYNAKKEIINIDKKNLYHSSVEFDKNFLNKTLEEILSGKISGKYSYYPPNHNKCLIQDLINEQNTGSYFKKLFELTFLNCIEHIRGTKYFEELDDLINIDEICNSEKFKKDKYEFDTYKNYILDYEGIINRKKPRKSKKSENK